MTNKLGCYLATVVGIVCPSLAPAQAQSHCDVAAFVWPAYQPDERFKEIGVFKDGKGEWESVYNAKPKFTGHRQPHVPLWGYQNEADPKVVATKIDAAVSHGVNVFIYDWYWYDGKPFLENAVDHGFLAASNAGKMQFYLMWANHDHTSYLDYTNPDKSKVYWKGAVDRPTFEVMVDHVIKDYFTKPNYYKIDGEPVFSIFEVFTFVEGMGSLQKARDALDYFAQKTREAGFPGLHVQGILWANGMIKSPEAPGDHGKTRAEVVRALGLRSLTNYNWVQYTPLEEYKKWGEKATAEWSKFSQEFTVPFAPHVSLGWDPNPRFPGPLVAMATNANPTDAKAFLQMAKAYVDAHPKQPRLITLNAWNEWAEGSYLEPDQEHGYDYLDAVASVFGDQ